MRAFITSALVAILAWCVSAASPPATDPVTPDLPKAAEQPIAICVAKEPGEPLVFGGRVQDYDGRPLEKAAVVAYHADGKGLYNPRDSKTRVPRLRGVAVTDEHGRFRFTTIRPAAYPSRSEPAHIHVLVTAPAHHPRYVDYWFEGDPLIAGRRGGTKEQPNTVIVKLAPANGGGWIFAHDIRLESN